MPSAVSICLAVEDLLSEAVLRAILDQSGRPFDVHVCHGRRGFGYLKKNIKGFNQASQGVPFFVLADLDRYPCAPALIADWLRAPKQPNLLFRIAVREIESWVLADREGVAALLGVRGAIIPDKPDDLPDPKQSLINLVRGCQRRELRSAIVPRPGSTAQQGPDYNGPLVKFVRNHWNLARAVKRSPSLERAVHAVHDFRPT